MASGNRILTADIGKPDTAVSSFSLSGDVSYFFIESQSNYFTMVPQVTCLGASSGSLVLSGQWDGHVRVWDLRKSGNRAVSSFSNRVGHDRPVTAVSSSEYTMVTINDKWISWY